VLLEPRKIYKALMRRVYREENIARKWLVTVREANFCANYL
jgi:hypothetical protein